MAVTVNKEVIKVHGVNPKPFVSKGKTISIGGLLVDPDRKLWVNVAPGLDMKVFQKGGSYEVEREILENGKAGNITNVLGFEAAAPVSSTGSNGQKQALDRDTRITLMQVSNASANAIAGNLDKYNEAFDLIKARHVKEGIL